MVSLKKNSSINKTRKLERWVVYSVSRRNQAKQRTAELDKKIDEGIAQIRETWAKLERKQLHGSYGKRELLAAIYSVYCPWNDRDRAEVRRRLVGRLAGWSFDPNAHLLELLIKVALPNEVRPNVIKIWAEAIQYGEAHHVRPSKLRSFFYVKNGLVRCARLFREDQETEREAKEEEEEAKLEEKELRPN